MALLGGAGGGRSYIQSSLTDGDKQEGHSRPRALEKRWHRDHGVE